jgi:hypothetical protein
MIDLDHVEEKTDADATYQQLLEECESQASADFDKTTVTLAGGALGVSMAFLKDIAPEPLPWSVWWLLAPAWGFLVLSLLSIFCSQMTSMESMRHELQCLKGLRKPGALAGGGWRTWTYRFNYTALVTCVLGIGLLSAFAIVNIGSRSEMPKPPTTQTPSVPPQTPAADQQRGRVTPDRPPPLSSIDPSRPPGAGRVTPDRPTAAPATVPPTPTPSDEK